MDNINTVADMILEAGKALDNLDMYRLLDLLACLSEWEISGHERDALEVAIKSMINALDR